MTPAELKQAPLAALATFFAQAVVDYEGRRHGEPDYRRRCRAFAAIRAEVERRGEPAMRTLLPLLEDELTAVRCYAAAFTYDVAPQETRAALLALAERGPREALMVRRLLEQLAVGLAPALRGEANGLEPALGQGDQKAFNDA